MRRAKKKVVDTNVLVTANGRNGTHASLECRLECVEFLSQLLDPMTPFVTVVDVAGDIQTEYRIYCNPSGQPSVGDRFYQAILQNYAGKVLRVDLRKDELGEHVDFPDDIRLSDFDRNDRKFAALAIVASASVANAVDNRSWPVYRDILREFGIEVIQLC